MPHAPERRDVGPVHQDNIPEIRAVLSQFAGRESIDRLLSLPSYSEKVQFLQGLPSQLWGAILDYSLANWHTDESRRVAVQQYVHEFPRFATELKPLTNQFIKEAMNDPKKDPLSQILKMRAAIYGLQTMNTMVEEETTQRARIYLKSRKKDLRWDITNPTRQAQALAYAYELMSAYETERIYPDLMDINKAALTILDNWKSNMVSSNTTASVLSDNINWIKHVVAIGDERKFNSHFRLLISQKSVFPVSP